MKALGISTSPRKGGNCEILTAHALKAMAEEGIETEIISLSGLDIRRRHKPAVHPVPERAGHIAQILTTEVPRDTLSGRSIWVANWRKGHLTPRHRELHRLDRR